jgi:uncharacterized phage infection (PIP) family protein YhgE
LTFTNIGRDVFPETVKAVQDVSTAMGQDLNQSAIQVGKALNDPVEGLSALRRVGIQFSDAQERQIKNFVELNDIASAQGIILTELNRQFGGSAEAARAADGGIIALGNSFGDLKETFGGFLLGLNQSTNATNGLTTLIDDLTGSLRGLNAALGFGDLDDQIAGINSELAGLQRLLEENEKAAQKAFGGAIEPIGILLSELGLFDPEKNIAKLNEQIAELEARREELELQATAEDTEELAEAQKKATNATGDLNEALKDNEELLKAVESALKQAENLQLSFARAAEDAARKQQRATDKLNRSQFKERVEFLNKQADEFDEFQADEIKSVQEAERKLDDARTKAGADRLREQAKLHRQLRQAEDRFNLTRLQGERRFNLDDRRLRAEGDILGLQELRENFALDQKANEENFDLQQRQTKENGREQEKERDRQRSEQVQALEQELSAIQDSLDQRRDEFLIAQDQEFKDLLNAQQEQRDEAERALREQEEDRRISQQRQLEDLGRSLADQEDLTAEGAARIAEELETVFGMEGVADNIMSGFTARTESEFRDLFENVEDIITSTEERLAQARAASRAGDFGLVGGASGLPVDINRPLAFDDGGVVPGPRGAPQPAIVHGGETILPTHRMSVPIIPSQNLNVIASGRISVEGSGSIDEAALVQVENRIADSMEIAIKRMARRG